MTKMSSFEPEALRRLSAYPAGLALLASGFALSSDKASAQPAQEPPGAVSASTVVSLTFDDTLLDQYQVRQTLLDHEMHGTFYVNSSRIGATGYMTLGNVQALQADGNEIAGHTVSHQNLTQLDASEQKRQICDDRLALLDLGFTVTSIAYPFGAADGTTEQTAFDCGYNSGRGVGGIRSPDSCFGCPYAEALPPAKPFHTRTPSSLSPSTTLASLQGLVTQAEQHGGGWVQLIIHHVCNGCSGNAVPLSLITSFLDWLEPRAAQGTVVKTVQEVIGGALQPGVAGPPAGGSSIVQNPSLEQSTGANGLPDCWQRGAVGTSTASYTQVADPHEGSFAHRIDVQSLTGSADRKLVTKQDLGACSPSVTPGKQYTVGGWYKTDSQSRLIAYYRSSAGSWKWWAQSPPLAPSGIWKQATWVTPLIPAGATSLSIGFSVRSTGSMTMDDFSLVPVP